MTEHYDVQITDTADGKKNVVVIDVDSGRRLSGTAIDSVQMVGVLIEDHRERAFADPIDPVETSAKMSRREAVLAAAIAALGDEAARVWLRTPNATFDGRLPFAVAAASDDGLAAVRVALPSVQTAITGP